MAEGGESSSNVIVRVYEALARALRVLPIGFDGTNYNQVKINANGSVDVSGTVTSTPSGTQDVNLIKVAGSSVNTGAGTAPASQRVAVAQDSTTVAGSSSLPTGSNVIGKVDQGTGGASAWKVDGSAVTQPVSGTVAVSNFPATQPVSGTVTANAGTNLNTSLLALEAGGNLASIKTDVDNLALAQASTTSGQKGNLALAAVTTSAPSYTTAQSNPLSLTTVGALRTDSSAVTQPVSGTVTITPSGTQDVNIAKVNNVTVLTGTGATGTGSERVTVAVDSATVAGSATLPTGTNSIGQVTANAGTNLNTSLLALEAGNVANLALAQGSTTSGQKGNLNFGAVTTSAPSYTTAQSSPLSLTTAGALRVDGSAVTQPVSGTITTTPAASAVFFVNLEGQKATYSASVVGLVAAAAATDIFTIKGSGTKTIRVTKIRFSGSATSSAIGDLVILKRSSADTGGTSTNPTMVPHDSADSAATATVNAYTANPTLGTLIGSISTLKTALPSATTPAFTGSAIDIPYGLRNERDIVLRGTAEQCAINLNGQTITGSSLDLDITWTEE